MQDLTFVAIFRSEIAMLAKKLYNKDCKRHSKCNFLHSAQSQFNNLMAMPAI